MANKKTRIACCGDSITFGLCATSAQKSYPSVLQTLLGEKFEVENFGLSGATVICGYEPQPCRYSPYVVSVEYEQAIKSKPDIVVLMLGMNDGNPTHHFNAENGGIISKHYLNLYRYTLEKIIDAFIELTSSPTLYLVRTTEMKRVAGELFSQSYVSNFTENLVKIRDIQAQVAQEKKVCIIDTSDEMQNATYYNDGCHLTDEGYAKLAEIIHSALRV